jgi:hypothetical protein
MSRAYGIDRGLKLHLLRRKMTGGALETECGRYGYLWSDDWAGFVRWLFTIEARDLRRPGGKSNLCGQCKTVAQKRVAAFRRLAFVQLGGAS